LISEVYIFARGLMARELELVLALGTQAPAVGLVQIVCVWFQSRILTNRGRFLTFGAASQWNNENKVPVMIRIKRLTNDV
jgi:hypothetical protein